jgi:acyl-CoA synthetase
MSVGVTTFDDTTVRAFTASGAWGDDSISDHVRRRAASSRGADIAYTDGEQQLSWRGYDSAATRVAVALATMELPPGTPVGVFVPDQAITHVIYVALGRAGLMVVGVGPRSGRHEIAHLLRSTQARALITLPSHRGDDQAELFSALVADLPALRHHVVIDSVEPMSIRIDSRPADVGAVTDEAERGLGPNDVFLVNATSGTTGLPKCVLHTENRWIRFAQHAVVAGELTDRDVMMSVLPSPYGFGLWSAHFLPTLLGIPTVLIPTWNAREALHRMHTENVTVFAGVTTQLMMLLDLLDGGEPAPTRLRVVFTGGEAVPYERALRFEQLTGARVLQFYGSNESGALSGTTIRDDDEHRLRTAGRILPEMNVELVDPATGTPVTEPGAVGQPTCYGPLMSPGYLNDPEANAALFDERGRLRMADLATISLDGYLTVVGRVADIIIRGGMNVSATDVEAAILTHPAVELAAVVAAPHEVFGEQVCAFVQLRPGADLNLATLRDHLQQRGMARYTWPEWLDLVDAMPRNTGEKIAKDVLRRRAASATKK